MFYFWLALLFLGIYGIGLLAKRNPSARWVRVLWSEHGPSLAAGQMTRRDCLRAAGGFGVIAIMGAATIWLIEAANQRFGLGGTSNLSMQVLLFTYVIILMMAVFATLYMLIRAPFRPRVLPDVKESLRHDA